MADLLEREGQLAALTARLTEARRGAGGAVLVEGPAGNGKTALLRALRAEAADAGFEVLPAVGGELEREFPFGLVRQLFEPRVAGAEPGERERLLSGAAARAAPLVGGEPAPLEASADASFAVLHGLYWLTAALAERAPVLLVVDDAHWGDAPSLRFLEFLARRAGELRVLVAVGARPNEPGAERALLAAIAEGPAAEVVHPPALSADAVRSIVTTGLGADADEAVVAGALRSTGGNPLLVRELVRELATAGTPATAAAVEAAVPSSVARAAERRLARLDAEAQAAARALAVLGDGTTADLLAAAIGAPAADVLAALDTLRGADLVEDDPPRFAHPLLRSAVAAGVTHSAADALHHHAARALQAAGADDGALVVHLLAAPPLGERWAADRLRASARRAAAEGAPDAGLRQLRRARVELDGRADADEVAQLELELAQLAASTGDPEAGAHLRRALAAPSRRIRAEAGMFGIAIALIQDPAEVRAMVETVGGALADLPAGDTAERSRVQSALLSALSMGIEHREARHALMEEVAADPDPRLRSYYAHHRWSQGADADEVRGLAREALAGRPMLELAAVEQPLALWAIETLIMCDDAETAGAAIADGEATARRHGSRHGAAMAAIGRVDWCLAFGSLVTAEDAVVEARSLFAELGIEVTGMAVRSAHAEVLVARGRVAEADDVLAGIPPLDADPAPFGTGNLWLARALVRLEQGRPDDAWTDLEGARVWGERFGWRRWARGFDTPLRTRAMVAREGDAGVAWGVARADEARTAGLRRLEAELRLATGDPAQLDAARTAAETVPSPFLQARVAFAQGAALRRAGQRVEARERLAIARALAASVGATGLEARATEELVVAGGRPRRTAASGADALTPAERRVAEHAATGLTNREIAEALFVTRKTVETTLGHAYSKLGIRSRAQLPTALGSGGAEA